MKLDGIVVSEQSVQSDDEYDPIYSNIEYINALLDEYVHFDEMSDEALKSYYVDYYLAQVNNGGFSQFVYNSQWSNTTNNYIRQGLADMGATQHLALFNKSTSILDRMGTEKIEQYLNGDYFGDNAERDALSAFDGEFFALQDDHDLIRLNAQWLKNHPKLRVLNMADMAESLRLVAKQIPDRDARIQQELDNEPRSMKVIRLLCDETSQNLVRVTAGDPTHEYEGHEVIAWYFITDAGLHYMIDTGDTALMFDGDSNTLVKTLELGDKLD